MKQVPIYTPEDIDKMSKFLTLSEIGRRGGFAHTNLSKHKYDGTNVTAFISAKVNKVLLSYIEELKQLTVGL